MAKKSPVLSALLPVGYILLGLALIIWPSMSTDIFCLVVGVGALAFGIFYFARYWQTKRAGFSLQAELIIAIVLAALGIFCLVTPRTLLSVLPFILGVILLIDGVGKIPRAMEMRALGFARWWVELIFAVITAGLGLVLVLNPFSLVRAAVIFFGVSLVISGLSDLFMSAWAANRR
ncbi:MAG TPA: DUF308 domain-containing protein [Candidatus Merdivicinus intestinigallinarum]|nr:DUF308 domain-containing protein [Candidatus Merdivicinus intestinigallinarum]